MNRKRAVVVFPGRGSYGRDELGYLRARHSERVDVIDTIEARLGELGGPSVRELDSAEKFSPSKHLPGRAASDLIYSSALADFHAIDRDAFDIVAVCGNSLGWYLTLAAGGAVSLADGARIVDTMGAMMDERGEGGQVLYPVSDRDWRADPELMNRVETALAKANEAGKAYWSIRLGGIAVLAGDEVGVKSLLQTLPNIADRFPLRLPRHAAFHTPMMDAISQAAKQNLEPSLFGQPSIPMIDGRGAIWTPHGCDLAALHEYTFGHQIVKPYDFGLSIEVAMKEFAPDVLILAGPGTSMVAPVGQVLLGMGVPGACTRKEIEDGQLVLPLGG